jgi:hypothetical protein
LSGERDYGQCEAPLPAEEKEMLGIYEEVFFLLTSFVKNIFFW